MAAKSGERLPRGRHGIPREVVVESQRSRMFRAMVESVGELGYGDTAVADVLERSGVSRKTFYEQFSSKEDCYLQAYDHILKTLLERVLNAYRSKEDWADGVRAGLDEFAEFVQEDPAYARAGIVEVLAAGPRAIERRDQGLRAFVTFFKRVRLRSENPDSVPEIAAEALVGAIHEIVYTRIVRDKVEDLDKVLPELAELALRLYGRA